MNQLHRINKDICTPVFPSFPPTSVRVGECSRVRRSCNDEAPLSYRITAKRILLSLPPFRRPFEKDGISVYLRGIRCEKESRAGPPASRGMEARSVVANRPPSCCTACEGGGRLCFWHPLWTRTLARARARAWSVHTLLVYTHARTCVLPSLLHPSPDLMPVRARAFERRAVRPSRGTISLFSTFSM